MKWDKNLFRYEGNGIFKYIPTNMKCILKTCFYCEEYHMSILGNYNDKKVTFCTREHFLIFTHHESPVPNPPPNNNDIIKNEIIDAVIQAKPQNFQNEMNLLFDEGEYVEMEAKKRCPRCEKDLRLREFARDKTKTDGLQTYCRKCKKELLDNWKGKNPDVVKKSKKVEFSGETKYCTKCEKNKPVAEFSINNAAKDGRQGHCKSCHNKHMKKYRAAKKGVKVRKPRTRIVKKKTFWAKVKEFLFT